MKENMEGKGKRKKRSEKKSKKSPRKIQKKKGKEENSFLKREFGNIDFRDSNPFFGGHFSKPLSLPFSEFRLFNSSLDFLGRCSHLKFSTPSLYFYHCSIINLLPLYFYHCDFHRQCSPFNHHPTIFLPLLYY